VGRPRLGGFADSFESEKGWAWWGSNRQPLCISKLRNAMGLFSSSLYCVVVDGLGGVLAYVLPPFVDCTLWCRQFIFRTICIMTRYQDDLGSLAKRSKIDLRKREPAAPVARPTNDAGVLRRSRQCHRGPKTIGAALPTSGARSGENGTQMTQRPRAARAGDWKRDSVLSENESARQMPDLPLERGANARSRRKKQKPMPRRKWRMASVITQGADSTHPQDEWSHPEQQ